MDHNQISLAPTVIGAVDSNILQIVAGPNSVPNAPGVGGTTVGTGTQPTSTVKAGTNCKSDNCLRAFAKRPEATAFCASYTAGGSQSLQTYAANGCVSSASRVSSACSCMGTATGVSSATAMTMSTTNTSTKPVTTTKPSTCNKVGFPGVVRIED
jgi:hypothetical protein